MPAVTSPEHVAKVLRLRRLLAAYSASEDLIRVGAYQKGTDQILDQAIAALPAINAFLQQKKSERPELEETFASLMALPG